MNMTTSHHANNGPEPMPSSQLIWRLAQVLSARRGAFLAIFTLVLAGVILGAYVKSPRFESKVQLFVKLERRDLSSSPSDTRYQIAQLMAEEAVASQAELLRAQGLIEELVDRLGEDVLKDKRPQSWLKGHISRLITTVTDAVTDTLASAGLVEKAPPRVAAIKQVQKGLRIYPVRKAQLIEVSFRSKNREAAPVVLSGLLDLYLKNFAELNSSSEDYLYYRDETLRQKEELEKAEQNLADFKIRHRITDLSAERSMLLAEVNRLTSILNGTLTSTQPVVPAQSSGRTDAATADSGATPGEPSQLAATLNSLRVERAKRLTRSAPNHPQIREIDNQIASAGALLRKEVAQIRKSLADHTGRLESLERLEPEIKHLTRQVKIGEDTYDIYRKATEDRRLAREQESRVSVQVVNPPSVPYQPLPPNRLTIVLAGLALSLVAALGAVLFLEWLDVHRVPAREPQSHAAAARDPTSAIDA